jgi:hypothetical protein
MIAVEDGMSNLYPIGVFFGGFFGGMGIFFIGVGLLWWISLQDREMRRRTGER